MSDIADEQNKAGWEQECFVGKNFEYYQKKWEKHKDKNIYKGWNWVALIYPTTWLIYRKLYREFFLYLIFAVITLGFLVINITFGKDNPYINLAIFIPIRLLIPFLGNYLYLKKVYREIEKTKGLNLEEMKKVLCKKGGVNEWIKLLVIIVYILSSIITFFQGISTL